MSWLCKQPTDCQMRFGTAGVTQRVPGAAGGAERGSRESEWNWDRQMITAFPFRHKGGRKLSPAGWGLPHLTSARPELETETQHRNSICLSIIILSVFRKDHDNTSKPAVIPGYSREGDIPGTDMAPRKQSWVPSLRWQLWALVGHTEHQEQGSGRSSSQHRHCPELTKGCAHPLSPCRTLKLAGHSTQTSRALLRALRAQPWHLLALPTAAQNHRALSKLGTCSTQMGSS